MGEGRSGAEKVSPEKAGQAQAGGEKNREAEAGKKEIDQETHQEVVMMAAAKKAKSGKKPAKITARKSKSKPFRDTCE